MTELALAARDGDVVAAAAFARSTYRDVWRFIAYLGHAGVADDLTQEVYVRALRALPGFRGDSSARTWLLSIARRTVVDAARAQRRRARTYPNAGAAAGHDDPAGTVELQDLLSQLEPDRREAFVLTQVVGLSYAEVAELCGCPIGTVRSRVARARVTLVGELTRAEGTESGRV